MYNESGPAMHVCVQTQSSSEKRTKMHIASVGTESRDILEVVLGHGHAGAGLIGKGPHDHRRTILVSGNKFLYHLFVVVQSLLSKIFLSVFI